MFFHLLGVLRSLVSGKQSPHTTRYNSIEINILKTMDITKKAKDELEKRIKRIEDFIAEKGVGSSYLARAKRVQRNINLAIVIGSLITFAGITVWLLNREDKE